MKMIFQFIMGILCINAAILLFQTYDGTNGFSAILTKVEYLTPVNSTQLANATGVEDILHAGSTSGASTVFYYIEEAMWGFYRIGSTLLVGFPVLLNDLGTPLPIVVAVGGLSTVMWALFFLELFAGRDVVD